MRDAPRKRFSLIPKRWSRPPHQRADAIEFAITGHLTRFAASDVEGGEHIEDYIWWRGDPGPMNREVKAVFQLDNGETGERIVTPKGISTSFDEKLLYTVGSHPPDPLARLVQTALIRDESIVRLSTDISEADRFDFFYKAIGITDLAKIEQRARHLAERLKNRITRLQSEYQRRREKVAQIIQEISEARIVASHAESSDPGATLRTLGAELTGAVSLSQLAPVLQRTIAEERQRILALEQLNVDLSQSTRWRDELRDLEDSCNQARSALGVAEEGLHLPDA